MQDPTTRFSNKVENYIRYRPGYPPGIISYLKEIISLKSDWAIADIGSGTGLMSKHYLENGNQVFACEPNAAMREPAEKSFSSNPNFISLDSSAESTGLSHQSVNLVVAAQAFHWFDQVKARTEFKRILKTDGWVLLLWNERRTDSSEFLFDYENLLIEQGTDYINVNHANLNAETYWKFFGKVYIEKSFENQQEFDYTGLKGRLLSCSYIPPKNSPELKNMLRSLRALFDKHQNKGKVLVEYDCRLFLGQLA